jgi:hypothetical protein
LSPPAWSTLATPSRAIRRTQKILSGSVTGCELSIFHAVVIQVLITTPSAVDPQFAVCITLGEYSHSSLVRDVLCVSCMLDLQPQRVLPGLWHDSTHPCQHTGHDETWEFTSPPPSRLPALRRHVVGVYTISARVIRRPNAPGVRGAEQAKRASDGWAWPPAELPAPHAVRRRFCGRRKGSECLGRPARALRHVLA